MQAEVSTPVRPEDQAAVTGIVQHITRAWNANNADDMSTVYAEDASVILPGAYLKGRAEIRDWLAGAFATKWKGTHVLGQPLELRYLRDDMLLLVSQGGAYPPGATEVPVEHAIRGMWLFAKQGGGWTIVGYGNTPVHGTIPLPEGFH